MTHDDVENRLQLIESWFKISEAKQQQRTSFPSRILPMHSGLSLFDSNYGSESPTQEPPLNILKLQVTLYYASLMTHFFTRNLGHYWTLWWKWNRRNWNSSCKDWALMILTITQIFLWWSHYWWLICMYKADLYQKMFKRSNPVNIETAISSILSKVRFSTPLSS